MYKINSFQKRMQQLVGGLFHQSVIVLFVSLLVVLFVQPVQAQSRGITITPVEKQVINTLNQGTYRALIIGNNDYEDPENYWPELTTAISDARAVADVLKTSYGFTDVMVLENSTRREILYALNDFNQRVETNDSVLLYYAGHGFLDENTQKGYWVPSDAEGTDHTTFLRNSTIRDEVSILASRAKHTLLISDSCFSGTLLRSGLRGAPPTENAGPYYQKVANKKSVQVLTAGGVEYVDDNYKDSGHSPFSYFLINELKHNDKAVLTASELSSNVEKVVANNVDQVPASGVLQGAGDELGEFIFLKVNVVVDGIDEERVKVQVNVVPKDEKPTAIPVGVNAEEPVKWSAGVNLQATDWVVKNELTNVESEAATTRLGLAVKVQKGRFYGGLSLLSGEFEFKDSAPVRPAEPASTLPTTISHSDTDLVFGYYFWPKVSLFLDLKGVSNEWEGGYKETYSGLGYGISVVHAFTPYWAISGSFGLVPMTIEIDGSKVGDANRTALEISMRYTVNRQFNINFGIKGQGQTNEYDSGLKQEYSLGALMFGANIIF